MANAAQIFGALIVSDTTANADIEMNSKTRPSIYPNVSGDLALQIRSAGNGAMQINVDNQGPVTIAGKTLQLQNLTVRSGTDMVIDANGNVGAQSSSLRYKENVATFTPRVEALFDLEAKTFTIRDTSQPGMGFWRKISTPPGCGTSSSTTMKAGPTPFITSCSASI